MSTPPKLEKAYITLSQPPASGQSQGTEIDSVTFQFNPKEYSIQKQANWKSEPARGATDAPKPEYTGANPAQLSVEVFVDATDSPDGDVSKTIDTLLSCTTPLPDTVDQNQPAPPQVMFGWGSKVLMKGVITSVNARYMLFRADGTPIRATATVSIQEVPSEVPRQNPTSGGLEARKTRMVVEGDTLASIAFREYGRPAFWRAVAEANGIDDPMRLRPGTELLLPPAEDVFA